MSRTPDLPSLLHIALVDLRAGKAAQEERLAAIAESASDAALRAILFDENERAGAQRARLDRLGAVADGPKNLWIAGILDDADRDARSHQPGRVLDIALIGAVRKAKAAEIVSSETAIALAVEVPKIEGALTQNRDEEIATDRALRKRLLALADG